MKKIAVLTSGGDSQGMNACVSSLVTFAGRQKMEIVGIRRGYQGLVENNVIKLTEDVVRGIEAFGGSFLKTARSEDFVTPEGKKKALKTLKDNNIDVLIVIGGNGSAKGVMDLNKLGVETIFLPGTIDNDLNYTSNSLGFDTAVNNSVNAIDKIKQTMESNDRGVVIEVMGRYSGDIALQSAVASNATMLVVNEKPETIKDIAKKAKMHYKKTGKLPVIVVAERILDIEKLAKEVEKALGFTIKTADLGYIQRGGSPTVFDRRYALELGVKTIQLINAGKLNRAIGFKEGKIMDIDMKNCLTDEPNFDFGLYEIFKELNS